MCLPNWLNKFLNRRIYWITKDLGMGGLTAVAQIDASTAVLNLCEEVTYRPPVGPFYHNGFPDTQPFPLEKIWQCVGWIDEQISRERKVLVHCAEGNSRSVSVVTAYLLFKGYSVDEAKNMVLTKKAYYTAGGKPTKEPQRFHEEFLAEWEKFLDVKKPTQGFPGVNK